MQQFTVFVVEDDENIREVVRCTLEAFSYKVYPFRTAEEMFASGMIACVYILDIMLPGMDGIEALKRLKSAPATKKLPVIMLTAKTGEIDKVIGLDSGADDYIAKPFGVLELSARLRAVLRRAYPEDRQPHVVEKNGVSANLDKREVTKDGAPLELTLKEYDLLILLMQNAERVLSRDELLNTVWGYEFTGETRTLDMHIKSVRAKLGDDAEHPRYIKTVRGVGYRFVEMQGEA
ncbi:MAG: response regulator transcription factor [Acetanaerobacterium sp.]